MEIDLHGLTQQEAIPIVQNAIIDFEQNLYIDELIIIVGKGESLSVMVENILDGAGLHWRYIQNNSGAIVIKK